MPGMCTGLLETYAPAWQASFASGKWLRTHLSEVSEKRGGELSIELFFLYILSPTRTQKSWKTVRVILPNRPRRLRSLAGKKDLTK